MTTDFLATSPGKRVLLGQLGARGDCLYASAVARQIKVDYPGCRLTWAVGSMCRPLIEGNPYVDEIWEIPMAGHGDMLAAWERFEAEARERQRHGDYDEVFFTQIYPNNFKNFDGTVRASIFRGYPHSITVPVAPVVRLTPQEVERVRAFAETHSLGTRHPVILFEFAGQSGQSFTGPEFALEAARAIVSRLPGAIVVLASHLALDGGHEHILDGSSLAFRENAELTKYCHLLIGCSSGLSWLCTSDWAKRLPTIQLLRRDTSVFASFVHDHEYFGLPTDAIIEMTNCPPARLAECAEAVFEQSFPEARQRYHERIALKFDFYARTLVFVVKRGYYSHVLLSAWNTVRRYGPRLGLLAVTLKLAAMGASRLFRGAVLGMAADGETPRG